MGPLRAERWKSPEPPVKSMGPLVVSARTTPEQSRRPTGPLVALASIVPETWRKLIPPFSDCISSTAPRGAWTIKYTSQELVSPGAVMVKCPPSDEMEICASRCCAADSELPEAALQAVTA